MVLSHPFAMPLGAARNQRDAWVEWPSSRREWVGAVWKTDPDDRTEGVGDVKETLHPPQVVSVPVAHTQSLVSHYAEVGRRQTQALMESMAQRREEWLEGAPADAVFLSAPLHAMDYLTPDGRAVFDAAFSEVDWDRVFMAEYPAPKCMCFECQFSEVNL